MVKLGEIVSNYRSEHGLSMDAFARSAGVSKPYISMIEKGVNPKTGSPIVPKFSTITKLADAMGMSVSNLLKKLDDNTAINVADESSSLSPAEKAHIKKYRAISDASREAIDNQLDFFYKKDVREVRKESTEFINPERIKFIPIGNRIADWSSQKDNNWRVVSDFNSKIEHFYPYTPLCFEIPKEALDKNTNEKTKTFDDADLAQKTRKRSKKQV